ncbi:hypothetical protein HKBW3S25_01392, partial [Candidatus Hakubella thermalkaliphila]
MVDTPHGKRCVGEIDGRLFRKKVKKSCHLMRALDAWAVQAEVVERAQNEGYSPFGQDFPGDERLRV